MKNKGKKIILILIIVIMFVAIGVAAYIYFGTDTFKSAQEMFQKYTVKTVAMVDSSNPNTVLQDYTQKLSSSSFEQKTDVTLEGSGKNISKDITKIGATVEQKSNIDKGNKSVNFSINYDKNPIFTANYSEDNDKIALSLPQIVSKYLSLNKAEYKDFASKFGLDIDMDKDAKPDYSQLLNFTTDQKNTLYSTYLGVISNSIGENSYSKQKKVNTMIDNQYVEVKTYTVSISNSEMNNCMKNILTTAKSDTFLLNIIKSKAEALGVKDVTDENIQKEIQNYIDEYDNKISNEQNPTNEAIKVVYYVQGSSVCKIDVFKDSDIYTLTFLTNTTDDLVVNINIQMKDSTDPDADVKSYSAKLERMYKDSSIGLAYNLYNVVDGEEKEIASVKYAVNKTSDSEVQSAIKASISNNNNSYTISANTTTSFKSDVEVAIASDTDCVDLNKYDKDTLVQLFTAIVQRIENIYDEQKEAILFSDSNNSQDSIKCSTVNNLAVSPADRTLIQEAVKQRGYFTYEKNDKLYLIVSSGVKSTGEYTIDLGEVKAKGGNIEINIDEKYVEEFASKEENPKIVYPFMVLELSKKPDYVLVRNDALRYEFQEIDLDAVKNEIENSEDNTQTNVPTETNTTNTAATNSTIIE